MGCFKLTVYALKILGKTERIIRDHEKHKVFNLKISYKILKLFNRLISLSFFNFKTKSTAQTLNFQVILAKFVRVFVIGQK